MSNRSLKTLDTISNQSNDLNPLLQKTRLYVEIRKRNLAGLSIEKENDIVKWICGLDYATKWLSQSSKIIGEHLNDVNIFRSASKHFAVSNKLNSKMQNFISEMTGGCGNAPDVLTERISDGVAPILCMIDSDKYSPESNGSASIDKCHKIIEDMKGISYFHSFDEREMENIIPLSFLKKGIMKLDASKDRDSILERAIILDSVYKDRNYIYKYIDIKKGTCRSWINTNGVSKFYENAPILYECKCQKDCDGFVSPPLFKEILIKTSEYLDECSEKDLRDLTMDGINQSWINLGALVFSMALSNNIRTT